MAVPLLTFSPARVTRDFDPPGNEGTVGFFIVAEVYDAQPNLIEMVVNLKTSKALGVVVPQALRLRADRLIE